MAAASARRRCGRSSARRTSPDLIQAASTGRHDWSVEAELVRLARINGYLGVILRTPDGPATVAFQPDGNGRIAAIYMVANPEKLGRIGAA